MNNNNIDDFLAMEKDIKDEQEKNLTNLITDVKTDAGAHYRHEYKGIQLDPFRISKIYKMKSFAMMTILKKCLCAGNRGHKDYKQDLLDIINAAERELHILAEDGYE